MQETKNEWNRKLILVISLQLGGSFSICLRNAAKSPFEQYSMMMQHKYTVVDWFKPSYSISRNTESNLTTLGCFTCTIAMASCKASLASVCFLFWLITNVVAKARWFVWFVYQWKTRLLFENKNFPSNFMLHLVDPPCLILNEIFERLNEIVFAEPWPPRPKLSTMLFILFVFFFLHLDSDSKDAKHLYDTDSNLQSHSNFSLKFFSQQEWIGKWKKKIRKFQI